MARTADIKIWLQLCCFQNSQSARDMSRLRFYEQQQHDNKENEYKKGRNWFSFNASWTKKIVRETRKFFFLIWAFFDVVRFILVDEWLAM